MALTNEQQKEIIPELDDLAEDARKIAKEIDYLQGRLGLYQNETLGKLYGAASQLAGTIASTNDDLKLLRTDWVKDSITSWYRDLHYDMHPIVEIREEDITDPVYERVAYNGDDRWEIIMSTTSHGRERIVLHACNGVDWPGVYSAEPFEEAT